MKIMDTVLANGYPSYSCSITRNVRRFCVYMLYRISTKGSGKAQFCTRYNHQACDWVHCKSAILVLLRMMKVCQVVIYHSV